MRSPCLIVVVLGVRTLAFADDDPAVIEATVEAPREPKPATGTFTVGAGFSTDQGFIATAGVVQADLLHTGTRLALAAEMSKLRQDARLRYDVPDALDTGFELSTELWTTRRQWPGFVRTGTGGAITVGREVERATRAYLRYRAERVATMPDDVMGVDDAVIAGLGAGLAYDTLDAWVLPRAGTRLALDVEAADRRLGSSVGLLRASAALDHARRLGPLTLRLQGRAAYVRGRDGARVPLSERYQHDGHGDLAGFGIGSIGVGMDGRAGGFDGEALGKVELELPIARGVSIAGYLAGAVEYNADPRGGPIGAQLHRSVGAAIIWRSPIGPLRFDWAIPLDGAERGAPQFFFGAGTTW